MNPQRRRQRPPILPQQLGDLVRELDELARVERGYVGKEHREIAEFLGDGGIRRGVERRVAAEEVEGRLEAADDQLELRQVAARIRFHLRLEGGEAEPLGEFAGGG